MTVGGSRFFLKLRKNHPVEFSEIFANFKDKTFINIAKVTFFKELFITLYTCLLIIPGIIKTYEYWAVSYILAVRPDIEYKEALRLSKTVMKGNKLDLFVLGLSFFGWNLLSVFSCALLSIFYVAPYMQATYAEFFSYIREDAIAKGVITPYDIPDYEPYVPPVPTAPFYSTSYEMNAPQGFVYPQGFAQPQNFTQTQNNVAPTTSEVVTEQPTETLESETLDTEKTDTDTAPTSDE